MELAAGTAVSAPPDGPIKEQGVATPCSAEKFFLITD